MVGKSYHNIKHYSWPTSRQAAIFTIMSVCFMKTFKNILSNSKLLKITYLMTCPSTDCRSVGWSLAKCGGAVFCVCKKNLFYFFWRNCLWPILEESERIQSLTHTYSLSLTLSLSLSHTHTLSHTHPHFITFSLSTTHYFYLTRSRFSFSHSFSWRLYFFNLNQFGFFYQLSLKTGSPLDESPYLQSRSYYPVIM